MRISDCLALQSKDLERERFTIKEKKTGKRKKVRLSPELRRELRSVCGETYVFPGRNDPEKHRTRQAVYKDIRRACKALRISGTISPHSLRKHYAVELLRQGRSLDEVKEALNHSSDIVTMLYAMADMVTIQATIKNRAKKG